MRGFGWFSRRGGLDAVNRAVDLYRTHARSPGLGLERFWAEVGPTSSPSTLAALIKFDLGRRFEDGERPRVLEYLERFPALAEDRDRVVSLVYEEFCLLEECGEGPDSATFCDDYGLWRDSLRSQLVYHRELSRAFEAEAPPVDFPSPGDRFDKYRLTTILGVGGLARVYLATEEELGGRQVAIKVSASFGQEPSILARLDHRNIVPIWTVARSESGLRGICMPYRPGVTLEDLIRRLGRGTPPRSSGAILEALRPTDPSSGSAIPADRVGWVDFPADRTFSEAVAWIGLALANALAYLHEQGVFHRDIKPANILLAYREGPQLLDFNLAQDPSSAEGANSAQKGGTLPYMAPEQLKASLDPSAWEFVEEAADLYSLGLVLRELLTGRAPELPTSRGSLAREIQSLHDLRLDLVGSISEANPAVPPALDSIVRKCLAFQPSDRYASANDLADDLRRFLDRQPLKVAPNTSSLELAVNWTYRYRRPVLATIGFLAVMAASIFSIRGDPSGHREKSRAMAHLDSDRPADWKLARDEFDDIRSRRPDTAVGPLGLVLTLRKLGGGKPDEISELFKEFLKKKDAEEVVRERIRVDPGSDLLHLNLGLVLSAKEDYDGARQSLEKALELDPRGIITLSSLTQVEEKLQRTRDALGHMTRAIELSQETSVKPAKIYEMRRLSLQLLVTLIDRQLNEGLGTSVSDRAQLNEDRGRVETQLGLLEDEWRKIAIVGGEDAHRYLISFYSGCLFSIRGALEIAQADPMAPGRLFDEAAANFRRARELARGLNAPRDRLQQIKLQEDELARRRRRPGPRI